ncbi:MAG: hypothetical protein AB7G37_02590 [Solirubrobacteraceae bacterium]
MDPDDIAYLVGLAEDVLGGAEAEAPHSWPWLRDDAGGLLTVDAYWPDHHLAVLFLDGPADAWAFAPGTLALRGLHLIGIDAERFTRGRDGRLERDENADRDQLGDLGSPEGRRQAQALPAAEDVEDMMLAERHGAYWPDADSHDGMVLNVTADEQGPEDALRFHEDDEDLWFDEEDLPPAVRQATVEAWEAPIGDEDPWDDFEDLESEPLPAVLDVDWRALPMALAAVEASLLARRCFARRATGDLGPLALQLLIVIAATAVGEYNDERVTRRALEARLELDAPTVASLIEGLLERKLLRADPDPYARPGELEITDAGKDAALVWLARIAPLFAGWPPPVADADDAH